MLSKTVKSIIKRMKVYTSLIGIYYFFIVTMIFSIVFLTIKKL